MLIVDDGSTDSTKQIVDNYLIKDKRIKYLHQVNKGTSSARNKGIKQCTGRYICLLDSDDLWNEDFLEKQLAFIKDKKSICVCSGYQIIKEDSSLTGITVIPKRVISAKDMSCIDHVGSLTGMYDSELYGKMYLNEDLYNILDDYFFWYEISKKGNIYGNSEVLAKYRFSNKSASSNKLKTIPKHFVLYHKFMKQNLLTTIKNLVVWGVYGIKKYCKIYIKWK